MRANGRPRYSASPRIRSRVMPGSSPTIDRRGRGIAVNNVDLPTLGRPTITTTGSEAISVGGSGRATIEVKDWKLPMQPEVLIPTTDHSEALEHNQTIRNIAIIAHVHNGKNT